MTHKRCEAFVKCRYWNEYGCFHLQGHTKSEHWEKVKLYNILFILYIIFMLIYAKLSACVECTALTVSNATSCVFVWLLVLQVFQSPCEMWQTPARFQSQKYFKGNKKFPAWAAHGQWLYFLRCLSGTHGGPKPGKSSGGGEGLSISG